MSKVFIYAEYQVSIPFTQVNWNEINKSMKKFNGLISKTWLSGINTSSVGGFYEFDSLINAQAYIKEMLIPYATHIGGNLSVKLFNGDVVRDANLEMHSPYYEEI